MKEVVSFTTELCTVSELAPQSTTAAGSSNAWINIWAIAGLVIKELYRRKDFYVLFILTALITLVLGSVNFFGDGAIIRFLKEITLLLIWVSSLVIAIVTAARQLPMERESRTIFPLLAKPATRSQLVLGKFLGCWLACGLALAAFYFFFIVVCGLREHEWPLVNYFQAVTLHWFMLAVLTAVTLLGSVIFAAPSSNTTIIFVFAAGILMLARHLNKIALKLHEPLHSLVYALYFLIPHLELFDVRDLLIHEQGAVPWAVWAGAALYAAVYAAIFLTVACWVFRRKPLN